VEQIAHILTEHGEVEEPRLSNEPQADESSGPGDRHGAEHDERQRDGAEFEIQEHEEQEQAERQDNRQPPLEVELILVAAGELVVDAGRQSEFARGDQVLDQPVGLLDHLDFREAGALVEGDVRDEEVVFALDFLRTADVFDTGQLCQGDLLAARPGHEDSLHGLDAVASLTGVADTDGVAFAAFDGGGGADAAQGDLDDILHIADADAVAGDLLAVDVDLQVRLADDAIGYDRIGGDRGDRLEHFGELVSGLFDVLEPVAEDLDSHRSAHARLQHHQSGGDGLQTRRAGHAGVLRRFLDLVPDVERRLDVVSPLSDRLAVLIEYQLAGLQVALVLGLVEHDGLDHGQRGGVERCFRTTELADHAVDLGNRSDRLVLCGDDLEC